MKANRETPEQRRNIRLAQRGYEAFASGDLDAIFALLDPAVELRSEAAFPEQGVARGHEGFVELVGTVVAPWDEFQIVVDEFISVGEDRVLVLHRQCGKGKGSGIYLEDPVAHLWTFSNGKATELATYGSWEEGRAAAGLTPS